MGILKSFQRVMQNNHNQKEIVAVRKMVEHKYGDVLCRGYRQKGIPCMTDHCKMAPCRDWEELCEDKLSNTIYANMPDSIRPRKTFHRGARGKRKAHGAN